MCVWWILHFEIQYHDGLPEGHPTNTTQQLSQMWAGLTRGGGTFISQQATGWALITALGG